LLDLNSFICATFFFATPIYLPYSLIIGASYRFAILADPTIPIIGEENQEPNDK
jgi:hypothetical protein